MDRNRIDPGIPDSFERCFDCDYRLVAALARHAKKMGTRTVGRRSRALTAGYTKLSTEAHLGRVHLVPELRPLHWCKLPAPKPDVAGNWRERYIEERLDHQERFFGERIAKLEKRRVELNRWATLLARSFACFGRWRIRSCFGAKVDGCARWRWVADDPFASRCRNNSRFY